MLMREEMKGVSGSIVLLKTACMTRSKYVRTKTRGGSNYDSIGWVMRYLNAHSES
jgi:hypothetical protein